MTIRTSEAVAAIADAGIDDLTTKDTTALAASHTKVRANKVDWKKVANERLRVIKAHERRAEEISFIARRSIMRAIHATCFASLSDSRVQAMIDAACANIERNLKP